MANYVSFVLLLLIGLPPRAAAQSEAGDCGYDRWPVKIARDQDREHIVWSPRDIVIADLDRIPIPEIPYPRDGRIGSEELTTYRIRAVVEQVLVESDRDWHIVLSDPDAPSIRMIVEIPDPTCAKGSGLEEMFAAARDSLRAVPKRGLVWITGVGFFDFIHTQRGRARNGFELHPVICITRQAPGQSITTTTNTPSCVR